MADNRLIWIVVLGFLAFQTGFLGAGQAPGVQTGDNGGGLIIDHITEDTTITLSGVNAFALGTAITGEYARVFISNAELALAADIGQVSLSSGTYTATPGDTITHYNYENSSTYYTLKEVFAVPDKGTLRKQALGYEMDTSPTLQFFNSDGDSANVAQAMATGQTKVAKIRYTATNDKALGNPNAPVGKDFIAICFEYNNSELKAPKLEGREALGFVPSTIASKNATTEALIVCYKGEHSADNKEIEYSVVLEALNNKDPAAAVTIWYEDQDYDINAAQRTELYNFADEDLNDLGITAVADSLIIS